VEMAWEMEVGGSGDSKSLKELVDFCEFVEMRNVNLVGRACRSYTRFNFFSDIYTKNHHFLGFQRVKI
jgi:hypothetical protein